MSTFGLSVYLFPKKELNEKDIAENNLKKITELNNKKFKDIFKRIHGGAKYSSEMVNMWDNGDYGHTIFIERDGCVYEKYFGGYEKLLTSLQRAYISISSFIEEYLNDFDLQPELKIDFYEVPWSDDSPKEYFEKIQKNLKDFANSIGADQIVPLYKDDELFVSLIPKTELKKLKTIKES